MADGEASRPRTDTGDGVPPVDPEYHLRSVPSPYRRQPDDDEEDEPSGQSIVSLAVHVGAWLLAAAWCTVELVQEGADRTVPATVLIGSTFLIVAPMLVVRWEVQLEEFERTLRADRSLDDDAWRHLNAALDQVRMFRHAIIATPVVLISVAYVAADSTFVERLNLPDGGLVFVIGLLIMMLGGYAAGWGVLDATTTIVLAVVLTRHRVDFAPYAGTTSQASQALASFCFSTAFKYGAALAILMPGLCTATWLADGMARLALAGTIVVGLAATVSLLAVPAAVLSRRGDHDRAEYLDHLSGQIDELATAASNPETPFDDSQYVRLRALLEMRSHVVDHTIENPSLELVKRIPVAIVLPTASVLASWMSLVAS